MYPGSKAMDPKEYQAPEAGAVVLTREGYHAFVPALLPPTIEYDGGVVRALSDADAALGELSGRGALLPNPHLLISPLVRREAVLSSRIEGTQASIAEVLLAEMAGDASPQQAADITEVRNYVDALEHGIERLATLPLSLRLVRELHERLMRGARGGHAAPGEFRRSQNWIGPPGSTIESAPYVPPPVDRMQELLVDWERFLHLRGALPDLVQCAVLHEQFEAIHPFLDGNGRVGRLLITLFLIERGRLSRPLLYLSQFFESNRDEYYERLQRVRTVGDWRGWVLYFLRGVAETADAATRAVTELMSLREEWRRRLAPQARAAMLVDALFVNPYVTVRRASAELGTSRPTARKAIQALCEEGILSDVSRSRARPVYVAEDVLRLVSA